MFLQATTSRRKNKTYTSWLVRESFRTPQGPRSRTVCNLSGLPEEIRRLVDDALRGKSMAAIEELELNAALDYGGLAVLRDAWQRFGLERFLADIPSARHRGLLKAMVFARLLFPCAKLALNDQAQGALLAAACGLDQKTETFDEDDLYEAMDQLNGRWVTLEKQLYTDAFTGEVRLVLYDLTSVYFEGKGPRGLGKYGHSRDHREDRPQIVLAVATDTAGTPIHMEVLRGNRGDTTTLQGLLATLRRRFGIREAIFVFDGGMSSKINLEQMEAQQLRYVTRQSMATLGALLEQLPRDQQAELWDRTRIMEVTHEGKRYVIAGGPWRQQRDEERRHSRIQKAEGELRRLATVRRKKVDAQKLASQVGRALARLKAHKYFDYHVDEHGKLQWSPKKELIDAERKLDGWYVLHTNLSSEQCDGQQTLAHYKNLLEVEEAFCQLKSHLEVRPVFHWHPDRVRNHVRICFLAYWLSARLGLQWRALGEKGEVPRLLRQMQTIRVGILRVKNRLLKRQITQIPPSLNALLKKLNLLNLFAQPPAWADV
ncbi:MAG: IS1634 family transposase [Verrucomicrobiae bacterium]|nr:IS1634 family transposase [Verrucomicrobiae bacterium]